MRTISSHASNKIPLSIIGLLAPVLLYANASFASGATFEAAVTEFNAGRYAQALGQFQMLVAQNQTDAVSLYYMALCHHHLHDDTAAAGEYMRVLAISTDPALTQHAQMGMQVISQGIGGGSGYSPQPNTAAAGIADPMPSSSQPWQQFPAQPYAVQPGQLPAEQYTQGKSLEKPTIIDFYTTWCGYCKRFAPLFAQAARKYNGQATFTSLNAEDQPNRKLVKRLQVRAFPTIVFLDAKGSVVEKLEGAPRTLPDFEARINRFLQRVNAGGSR